MPTYFYAQKNLEDIEDGDLNALFDEIVQLRNIPRTGMILQFLQQAHQPIPPIKGGKIVRQELMPGSILLKTVKQIGGTEIYPLCADLARIARIGTIENHGSMRLYSLLNKIELNTKPRRRM